MDCCGSYFNDMFFIEILSKNIIVLLKKNDVNVNKEGKLFLL